jgi:hypothetical protein
MNRPAEAGAGSAVERYLADVTARLPGPARDQADIVAELRSGLLDAMDAHASAGLPPAEAARAAVREFGDPARVAIGFGAEIAASQARRVAVTLLVTGPLVGLLWVATARASHLGMPLAPHLPWAGPSPGLRAVIYLAAVASVAVAAAVTAWAAVVGIATTGRLTRWRPARPRQAPMAAAIAGFGAVSADGLGLALLAAQLAIAPGKLSPLLAGTAAAASLARMMLARRAAHRCLVTRASLT